VAIVVKIDAIADVKATSFLSCVNVVNLFSIMKGTKQQFVTPKFNIFKQVVVVGIDIKRRKNRLLKFCYVPATSASLPRVSKLLLFFSFFVAAAIDSTNEINKVT
jgi:hypothetical protein